MMKVQIILFTVAVLLRTGKHLVLVDNFNSYIASTSPSLLYLVISLNGSDKLFSY